MKKLIVSQLMLLVLAVTFLYSCKKDHDDAPQVLLPKLDGLYIYGTNTVATEPTDPNAKMSLAVLDPTLTPNAVTTMDNVFGKFLYIGANSTISFAFVDNEVGTPFGVTGGGTYDSASMAVPDGVGTIKDKVYFGTLTEKAAAINVAEEGLYYAFVNMDTKLVILMKVRPTFVGDALFTNYDEPGVSMPQTFVSADSAVFTAPNTNMKLYFGYKYRFNSGWAVYDDQAHEGAVVLGSLGVAAYADSYTAGFNDIGYYGDNAVGVPSAGTWNMTLVYTASTNTWKERRKRTGDLPPMPKDFTGVMVGLEGNAYKYSALDTGKFAGDGTDVYESKAPTKNGDIYTWTWTNVSLITNNEFIFLQEGKWGAGLQIDGAGVAASGAAWTNGDIVDATAAPYSEAYHNFRVVNGKDKDNNGPTYDITLVIDGKTSGQSATFVRH